MGQLLWTCGNGIELNATTAGYRLSVSHADAAGFHFTVATRDEDKPLASGSSQNLRDAIEAAERAVVTLATPAFPG